jgi:hypothetical protein
VCTRVVQLSNPVHGRKVALVQESTLRLLHGGATVYEFAQSAIQSNRRLCEQLQQFTGDETLDYDVVYEGRSNWQLLPPIDHPEPARCFVTGTGLTHQGSADNRQSMHEGSPQPSADSPPLTDSMKMFELGCTGGRPEPGCIGNSPEWFYKGVGYILRAHNEPLSVPSHACDGGEEAEIAGVYLIGPEGTPYRIAMVQANEFSDHVLEAQNYLYLASSKLRDCSVGPELVVDPDFDDVPGRAEIQRGGRAIWQAAQASGERRMCHSLANLEHHHFKHAEHCRPGDVHIHFFGADMFSFKDRLRLEDGDVMQISFEGFGRPLRNPIRIVSSQEKLVAVRGL